MAAAAHVDHPTRFDARATEAVQDQPAKRRYAQTENGRRTLTRFRRQRSASLGGVQLGLTAPIVRVL
jgi:hypothetical protein